MIQRASPSPSGSPGGSPTPGELFCDRASRRMVAAAARQWRDFEKARAAAAAAGGGPALNLEEHTLELQSPSAVVQGVPIPGELACKVTEYSDGVRAVIYRAPLHWRRRSAADDADSGGGRSGSCESTGEGSDRSANSIGRSRATVVHRARCLEVHSMWTFTKRGKFDSVEAVWAAWRLFTQSMRRRWKKNFRYVAVPELHADGVTWHLHVLFDRYYQVETLRRYWYRALGGKGDETGDQTPGAVNVKALRTRNSAGRAAARYIAKYVGKGFERGRSHSRLFACSAGLHPVGVRAWRDGWTGHLQHFTECVAERLCRDYGLEKVYPRTVWRDAFGFAVIDVAARVDGRGHLH